MATEFAIAAGLLEVASFGIELTRTLHDLGTTAREAGEQTDLLAKNITHHCRALKELGRQIKVDNPDHSAEALELVKELRTQSTVVLKKIKELLPRPRSRDDRLSFKQRLIWALRKRKVAHLIGQLEYLRSTVTLLFHVLSTVPNLRKYRQSNEPSAELREEITDDFTQAQNLLYERYRAQEVLPELAAEDAADDEADEIRAIEIPDVRSSSPTPPYSLEDPAPHPGNCLAQIDAYANELMNNESGALVWQRTTSWLAQLYGRWTTLPIDDSIPRADTTEEEDASQFDRLAISDVGTSYDDAVSEQLQTDNGTPRVGSETGKAASTTWDFVYQPEEGHVLGDTRSTTKITFGGGTQYQNTIAYFPLLNSLMVELDKITNEIRHLKVQLFTTLGPENATIRFDLRKRLCELEFQEILFRADHHVHELWPLQSAYITNINNLILVVVHCRNTNKISTEGLVLDNKLTWLRFAREEYKMVVSDDHLMIQPANHLVKSSYFTAPHFHQLARMVTTYNVSPVWDPSEIQAQEESPPTPEVASYEERHDYRYTAPYSMPYPDERIPNEARWTKVSSLLVRREALKEAHERFEERDGFFIVLRVLQRREIDKLVDRSRQIRAARSSRSVRFHEPTSSSTREASPTPPSRSRNFLEPALVNMFPDTAYTKRRSSK